MAVRYRTIVEQQPFVEGVNRLGGAPRIDKALTAIMGVIAYRPEVLPLIGRIGWRLIKTDPYVDIDTGEQIPALRVYFQLSDAGDVWLWWIEEMPHDDEIPF